MADSNRVTLSWSEEATFGVDPDANYDILRITSESLGQDTSFNSSPEIRALREIRELNRTNRGVSGNIASTCYFGGVNQGVAAWYRYAMGSAGDYSDGGGGAGTPEVVVAAAACTVTSNNTIDKDTGTWTNAPSAGDWVSVTGLTATADEGWYKVISATTSQIVIDGLITNESSVSLTIYNGSSAGTGNNLTTLHIQREYGDLGVAAKFGGCAVNSWEFSAQGQDIITNSFDIVGVGESTDESPTSATASSNLAAMTSIDGVQFVRYNGQDVCALGVNFTVTNNLRQRYCLGTFGPEDMQLGDLVITGNIQMYLEDDDSPSTNETSLEMMDYYLNNTAGRLAIGVSDEVTARGNAKVFDFPNIEFTSGRRVAGGRNQDVIVDLSFQALYDTSDSESMRVHLWTSA